MIKTKLSLIFLFFSTNLVFASTTTVLDPKNLLTSVDTFLKSPSFEQALLCGTKAEYSYAPKKCELTCEKNFCTSTCENQIGSTLSKFVSDCTTDSAFIYSDRGDSEEVTRIDFEANSRNMARRLLNNLGDVLVYDLKVVIENVENSTYTLNRDLPDSRAVPSMNIFAKIQIDQVEQQPQIIISVILGPAVAQIVRLRVLDQTWFLLKDYK